MDQFGASGKYKDVYKVSIIVPVYKVPEKYLRQCVDSLTNQTYKDIEIILVDDGCPDGGGNMCDAIALEDSRIRTIHKKNGGLVSARNAGYREAKGEWFYFMDSDFNQVSEMKPDFKLNEDELENVIDTIKRGVRKEL